MHRRSVAVIDPLENVREFSRAIKHGGFAVWPGCGKLGPCMPCGAILDYGQLVNGVMRRRYRCIRHTENGCPDLTPIEHVKHIYPHNHRTCAVCGHKKPQPQAPPVEDEILRRMPPGAAEILLTAIERGRTKSTKPSWSRFLIQNGLVIRVAKKIYEPTALGVKIGQLWKAHHNGVREDS